MSVLMLMVALVTGACYNRHIEPEPLFTAEDFPLKVGNWWRYRLTDDENNTVDTLLMRIDSVEYTVGENRFHCSFHKRNIIERGQIRRNDTVIFYKPVQNQVINGFTLGIPFGVDSFFINRVNGRDTVRVLSYEKEYELFGKKYEAFHIKSSMVNITTSSTGTNDMRVSPDIGIISNDSYFDYQFGIMDTKLELIEYHIE